MFLANPFLIPSFSSDFATVFFAILIEAIPFITLGVIVSALLTTVIRDEWLLKLIPKNKLLAHVVVGFLGFLFPVCECGNVPVARRLITKGLSTSQAITFLLAAPVVNPIVILVTYTAFRFSPEVVFLRVIFSLLIAIITGLIISLHRNQEEFLTDTVAAECAVHHHFPNTLGEKTTTFFSTLQKEVIEMTLSLLVGASIAAFTTSFSRESIVGIAQSPVLATISMMTLAFILSICSTVDAFVALGYVGTFPMSSIIAFLVFGPMIDLRVISMMRTTFSWKLIWRVVLIVTELVLIASLALSLLGK